MSLRQAFLDIFSPPETWADAGLSVIAGAGNALEQKPRLASVKTAPSRDEFKAWRDDPVTRFVMAGLTRNAEECREQWLARSWGTGTADQLDLTGLRERADAIMGFVDCSYEGWRETLGVEPEADNA